MLGLYCDLYRGFMVKYFHEQGAKRHNYVLGYTVTKVHLQREDSVQRPEALGALQEAAASADGRDNAASGRLDARPACVRPAIGRLCATSRKPAILPNPGLIPAALWRGSRPP
jgi:hypothetical protein